MRKDTSIFASLVFVVFLGVFILLYFAVVKLLTTHTYKHLCSDFSYSFLLLHLYTKGVKVIM